MLENFEAKHKLERAVVERQVVDALTRHRDRREPARSELDRVRAEIDRRNTRRQQRVEPGDGLALPAARVEQRPRRERLDHRLEPAVEAIDQPSNDGVTRPELGQVGALDAAHRGAF